MTGIVSIHQQKACRLVVQRVVNSNSSHRKKTTLEDSAAKQRLCRLSAAIDISD